MHRCSPAPAAAPAAPRQTPAATCTVRWGSAPALRLMSGCRPMPSSCPCWRESALPAPSRCGAGPAAQWGARAATMPGLPVPTLPMPGPRPPPAHPRPRTVPHSLSSPLHPTQEVFRGYVGDRSAKPVFQGESNLFDGGWVQWVQCWLGPDGWVSGPSCRAGSWGRALPAPQQLRRRAVLLPCARCRRCGSLAAARPPPAPPPPRTPLPSMQCWARATSVPLSWPRCGSSTCSWC